MTTMYFVRHGSNDWLGKGIAGRTLGVNLNEEGCRQVEQVADWLARLPVEAVYASPLDRAQESAEPLASRLSLPVLISEDINEVDFGNWNGKSFEELDADPRWRLWNSHRSGYSCPAGESFTEVVARMNRFMRGVRDQHPNGSVAAYAHGDPIKAAMMSALSIPVDFVHRVEVSPASITAIEVADWGMKVLFQNLTVDTRLSW